MHRDEMYQSILDEYPAVIVKEKDEMYTITFTIKALDPQATALIGSNVYLTDTETVTLAIDGSMYDDDATGDS